MTPEQQNIERVRGYLEGVANRGISQTLLDIQEELVLLQELVKAGIGASLAEIRAASNDACLLDERGDEARARQSVNGQLSEQLSSIHTTTSVLICTLAGVRTNAEACSRTFDEAEDLSIDDALVDALVRHPEHLDNAAAGVATRRQDDSSATATLRRQLNTLLEGQ
jgi:hypothetical protein